MCCCVTHCSQKKKPITSSSPSPEKKRRLEIPLFVPRRLRFAIHCLLSPLVMHIASRRAPGSWSAPGGRGGGHTEAPVVGTRRDACHALRMWRWVWVGWDPSVIHCPKRRRALRALFVSASGRRRNTSLIYLVAFCCFPFLPPCLFYLFLLRTRSICVFEHTNRIVLLPRTVSVGNPY